MVEIYKTDNKVLQKLDNIEEGCWVNMIDPTSGELSLVSGYFEIDLADLATALDEEESSRISLEDGYTLILVDIPTPEVRHEKKMYTTIPLGIILKNDAIITICREAYEYLCSDEAEHIDILLTDVKMPFMDGITLIKKLNEDNIKLKTIIFSGYNEFEYAKLAVKLGVKDYILKPVDPVEFENTIKKVCAELDEERIHTSNYNKQADFVKQFYLYSLLNKADTKGILENDDFLRSYNRLILIEFNTDFFGKYDGGDANILTLSDCMGDIEYQYLNLNTQQSVILIKDEAKALSMDLLKNMLEKLHNYIFGKTGQFMYAAVSDIIDDYHRISDMMDELENLMSNKFYQTNNYIFTNDISDKMPVFVQIDDDVLMKQMKQDIKMKDVTFLRIHFDALCKKYRSQSNFSHIYIKFVFSNLLKDFYDALPGANEDEFASQIDKLYTSEDFNCIMDIVNHNIDILEKSFISNPLTMHREIETVKEYIHNHYSEELGAQQLADMVYLAPSYLSSLFKKETGQNLSKYIKQYRMEKAKELLTDTNMKIVNISEKTGYPNVSYFCQSFREYFGVSPQKFRDKGEVL